MVHPEDGPPEWDPWAVKKTLQLSTPSMSCGFGKPLMGRYRIRATYYCTPVHPFTPFHPLRPSTMTPVHPLRPFISTPVDHDARSPMTPVHLYARSSLRPSTMTPSD
ncbi:hypothetical protein ACJ73_03989 [Blastomyces percursus]|uniref:Uncharacterized protein n=1 Tax=Blastomyces percursus TaxID=1658174 RepID=A0A1J9RAF8_9EURO|nr:hypothetical protein ACJ73_03989 [Blastomyces percursus]